MSERTRAVLVLIAWVVGLLWLVTYIPPAHAQDNTSKEECSIYWDKVKAQYNSRFGAVVPTKRDWVHRFAKAMAVAEWDAIGKPREAMIKIVRESVDMFITPPYPSPDGPYHQVDIVVWQGGTGCFLGKITTPLEFFTNILEAMPDYKKGKK